MRLRFRSGMRVLQRGAVRIDRVMNPGDEVKDR